MLCWRTSGKLHSVAQWKGTRKPKREYKEYTVFIYAKNILQCVYVHVYLYILVINMYNVQPSSIYIFKRRPPRADPPNGGGEPCSYATTSSRFWQSCLCRCSVAQAVSTTWALSGWPSGVLYRSIACLTWWMMDCYWTFAMCGVLLCCFVLWLFLFCDIIPVEPTEGSNLLALESLHGLVGGRKLVVLHCSMSWRCSLEVTWHSNISYPVSWAISRDSSRS